MKTSLVLTAVECDQLELVSDEALSVRRRWEALLAFIDEPLRDCPRNIDELLIGFKYANEDVNEAIDNHNLMQFQTNLWVRKVSIKELLKQIREGRLDNTAYALIRHSAQRACPETYLQMRIVEAIVPIYDDEAKIVLPSMMLH